MAPPKKKTTDDLAAAMMADAEAGLRESPDEGIEVVMDSGLVVEEGSTFPVEDQTEARAQMLKTFLAEEEVATDAWHDQYDRQRLLDEYPRLRPDERDGKVLELRRLLRSTVENDTFDIAISRLASTAVHGPSPDGDYPPRDFRQEEWAEVLPEMHVGDQGPTVGVLQRFLRIPDNHVYGEEVALAVRSFRSYNGLDSGTSWDRACWRLAFGVER